MLKTTASRLAFAMLGYVILILLLLTLNPFYMVIPQRIRIYYGAGLGDVVGNILLFIPVGFLYRLATRRSNAWLFGAVVSTCIELVQIFIPARTTSPVDLLMNTLGAGLGGFLHDLLLSRIAFSSTVIGRLRLDTPLMSLVYLFIPLLWVNSLALVESPQRWPLTLLIGMCGAFIFNDVYRKWLSSDGLRLTIYASFSAGVWFLFGAGISLLQPFPSIYVVIAVVTFTALLTILPRPLPDRRFEQASLRRVIPLFALYVALLALWPPNRPFVSWHGIFGLTDRIQDSNTLGLLPRIEYLVAFSILGFLISQWRGRSELTILRDLPGLLVAAGGSACLLEGLVGFQAGMGASLVRLVLVTSGALYGGVTYHLLRDQVRFLLGRGNIPS